MICSARSTVEDCIILSSNRLAKQKLIGLEKVGSTILRWNDKCSMTILINTITIENAFICLYFQEKKTGKRFSNRITLNTTVTPWGSLRWWFKCPLFHGGIACGRRVQNLYLPPDLYFFGCRHCYDLTYSSCRKSHRIMVGKN